LANVESEKKEEWLMKWAVIVSERFRVSFLSTQSDQSPLATSPTARKKNLRNLGAVVQNKDILAGV